MKHYKVSVRSVYEGEMYLPAESEEEAKHMMDIAHPRFIDELTFQLTPETECDSIVLDTELELV